MDDLDFGVDVPLLWPVDAKGRCFRRANEPVAEVSSELNLTADDVIMLREMKIKP